MSQPLFKVSVKLPPGVESVWKVELEVYRMDFDSIRLPGTVKKSITVVASNALEAMQKSITRMVGSYIPDAVVCGVVVLGVKWLSFVDRAV